MLIVKTAGIVLILGGCGAWGLLGARHMEKRVEQLSEIRRSLAFLEREITCAYTPLPVALQRTARFSELPVSILFSLSAARLEDRQGMTAEEAWRLGVEGLKKSCDLIPADLKLLENAGRQIGLSSAAEQKKLLLVLQEELLLQEEKARAKIESERKIRAYGGFILGAAVVIILI